MLTLHSSGYETDDVVTICGLTE